MTRKIIYGLILSLSMFFVVGCGSDDKADPIVDNTGPYAFFNATTPVTITEYGGASCSSGTCTSVESTCTTGTCPDISSTSDVNSTALSISVQLLKNGLVEPGELVQMLPFNLAYGSVVETVVITDGNGRAIFEYEAPVGEDYNAIRGQDITIQAVFLDPYDVGEEIDPDKEREVILTQDFLLQFR